MSASPLRTLLSRIEAATEPSREVDRALHTALGLDMDDEVHRGVLLNAYTSSLDGYVYVGDAARGFRPTGATLALRLCAGAVAHAADAEDRAVGDSVREVQP